MSLPQEPKLRSDVNITDRPTMQSERVENISSSEVLKHLPKRHDYRKLSLWGSHKDLENTVMVLGEARRGEERVAIQSTAKSCRTWQTKKEAGLRSDYPLGRPRHGGAYSSHLTELKDGSLLLRCAAVDPGSRPSSRPDLEYVDEFDGPPCVSVASVDILREIAKLQKP